MNTRFYSFELSLRLVVLCAAAFLVFPALMDVQAAYFVMLLLLLIFNTQIRVMLLKNNRILPSIALDGVFIVLAALRLHPMASILFLIPLMHGFLYLEGEKYLIMVIFSGLSLYLLRESSLATSVMLVAFIPILFICITRIRELSGQTSQLELLYDQNRKYSYELESTKLRLEEYSKTVESLSSTEERNKISRELHDSLGHKLTGVLMQLEASLCILENDPQKGMELLKSTRDNLRACNELMRQTVREMKPREYKSRILSIQQLLTDFSKSTGTNIRFQIKGSPYKLTPGIEITLYKSIQEAVTNSVKHGSAKNIQVELCYESGMVSCTISDDGLGCANPSKGMGLSGMEERAHIHGGRLTFESNKGFLIRTEIPFQQSSSLY